MKAIYFLLASVVFSQQWYQSNMDMFDIAPISASEREDHEIVLKITETDRRELRELYQRGTLLRTNLQIYSLDRWLLSEEIFDAEGRVLERRTYFYEPDGVPRSVFREIPSDPEIRDQITFYQFEENGLTIFELPFETAFSQTIYDEKGRVISREKQSGDKLLRSESSDYFDDGRSETRVESDGGFRRTQRQGGLKRVEEVYKDDILQTFIVYTYNDQDQIESILEESPSHTLERRFQYDEEGTVVQETSLQDGIIFQNIEYHEDGGRTELLYREGGLFLRAVFRDELIVERVFFDENGHPIDIRRE